MIDIATESDIERLRQVALLMAAENEQLHKRPAELTAELAAARGTDRAAELRTLQSQLAERSRMLFGPRSERRPRNLRSPVARFISSAAAVMISSASSSRTCNRKTVTVRSGAQGTSSSSSRSTPRRSRPSTCAR